MAEWKFARRRDRCNACEAAFEEGARHVSTLSLAGEDLARSDLCVACFESRSRAGEIVFWYTRHSADRRGLRLDLPMLEQLFHRLESRAEEAMVELRYVLGLLLMRKKRLKLVRIAREEAAAGETMIVRRPRRDEALRVAVRDLAPERIEALRRELAEIFEGAEALPTPGGAEEVPPALASAR